jgi:hypothetical protein
MGDAAMADSERPSRSGTSARDELVKADAESAPPPPPPQQQRTIPKITVDDDAPSDEADAFSGKPQVFRFRVQRLAVACAAAAMDQTTACGIIAERLPLLVLKLLEQVWDGNMELSGGGE